MIRTCECLSIKIALAFLCTLCCFQNVHAMERSEDYGKLLEKAAQAYGDCDLEERESIIKKTRDWALIHNPELLDKAFDNFVSDYLWIDEETNYDSLCSFLDQYSELNYEKAMERLDCFIKEKILEYEFPYYYSDIPIKLLQVLKKRNPAKFALISREVIPAKLNSFLLLGLAYPEEIEQLEDEQLSVSGLITAALDQVQSNPKETENLNNIFARGAAYHIQFEQEIAKLLPAVLKKNPFIGRDLIEELFKSPSYYLREKSLSSILDYLACDGSSEDVYWKKGIIKDLLKNEENAPLPKTELYPLLFNTFLKSTSPVHDFGIQILILHLIQQSDYVDLGRSYLGHYLNITSEQSFQNQHLSINESFKLALETESITLTQLNSICAVAKETGFENYISDDDIQNLKIKLILNEETPLTKRAQFFDEVLIARIDSKENYADLAEYIEQLPFSPFKRYAHVILIALDQTLHQTAYFAARAELHELSQQYSEFYDEPPIMRHCYELLFHAFNRRQKKPEPNHIHIDVQQAFSDPFFPEGPYCFGYVNSNHPEYIYRIYACNKKTGLPVWISPIKSKEKLPYTILKDAMYCVTESGSIIKLDILNGDAVQEFTLEEAGKVQKLYAIADQEKLYVLYEKSIFLVDLKTDDYQKIMLPEQTNGKGVLFVGGRLVSPLETDLFIINSDGQTKTIPYNSSTSFWFSLSIKGTSQFMVYEKEDEKNSSFLVCLDADTGKQLWEYPINSSIKSIKISPHNDFVFVLTDYAVMAFALNSKGSNPLIWETRLERNFLSEIDSIYLSNDSSTLYGLETNYGKLYKFDIKTGQKTFIYEKKLARVQKIVGDFEGKLYIQGISF